MTELSLHFERVETPVYNVVANSEVEYVFLVNPPREQVFPRQKVIGRFVDQRDQEWVSEGAWGAEKWWFNMGHLVKERPWLWGTVPCNEPVHPDPYVIRDYLSRWADICRREHPQLKIVGPNFSTGYPEPELAPMFAEAIRKMDIVAFHEYWMPEHWQNAEAWVGWLMGRYVKFMEHLPVDLQTKPIMITEAGCDGLTLETLGRANRQEGWQSFYPSPAEYLTDIERYSKLLGQDPRVKAIFIYEAGPWPKWKTYEVDVPLAEGILALNTKEGNMEPTLRVKMPDGTIKNMDVEDYVKGVVPREVYASWPEAVLQAQAVAARTYAMATTKHKAEGFDVCTDSGCCQAYSSARHNLTSSAVEATRGIVGVHRNSNRLVPMFYSASCGGRTIGNWADYLKEYHGCPCNTIGGKKVNGHQNGLCQWGGYYLARQGRTYQQILDTYYDLKWVHRYGAGEEETTPPPSPEPEPDPDWGDFERRLTDLEEDFAELVNNMSVESAFGRRFWIVTEG